MHNFMQVEAGINTFIRLQFVEFTQLVQLLALKHMTTSDIKIEKCVSALGKGTTNLLECEWHQAYLLNRIKWFYLSYCMLYVI